MPHAVIVRSPRFTCQLGGASHATIFTRSRAMSSDSRGRALLAEAERALAKARTL